MVLHRIHPRFVFALAIISATGQPARAVLEARCASCHGETRMSGLNLRDAAGVAQGGSRGPAVVPGNAEASLLFKAIKRDGELKMPPGKDALSNAEIATIKAWIDSGARFDSTVSPARRVPSWWSFRVPVKPAIPPSNAQNPIDAFIAAKAAAKGLSLAPEAPKATLIRRAYFDLLGIPPPADEVDQFVKDPSASAYEKLIDKLLASPRYGERWGRYWLDLVRYADTSGFETDHFFVNAWRYRDYVIGAFNSDKPYDVFVKEQIAADEIWPPDIDLEGASKFPKEKQENQNRRIATGLFTVGSFPIEYTYYGHQFRAEWQAEAVDTIGAAFLGLTVGCARCHDHKFDPITQRDYYSMTALFAGSIEREIQLGSLFDVQTSTRSFPLLAQAEAYKQMLQRSGGRRGGSSQPSTPDREALLQKLGEAYLRAPNRPPIASVLGHDELVRDTHILMKGDFKTKGAKVEPGFIMALNEGPAIVEPKGNRFLPERRKALAEWLTAKDQPLLARVMVNRIWQGHFGEGIVRTPSDFGRQGDPPTHPELLDWLAVEFVERKYSIKSMHKLIMLSAAYKTSSIAPEKSRIEDPENLYLTHMNRRRLDADAIRDSALAVAGSLNLKMGGVGIIPQLTSEELLAARMPNLWPAHPDPAEHNRRSVYLQMKRSLTLPMLQIFDAPDTSSSCARRERSTVSPQALALMNSAFSSARAKEFAARVQKQGGDEIGAAWKIALGRLPSAEEKTTAADYLQRNSLERLCLLLLNTNEFLYVD